jgi:hypothetical protein
LSSLREIFLQHGHIFVSSLGYVSIEIYSADVTACDYIAQMIGGKVKRHLSIRKVAIHNRPTLVQAAQKLLEVVYDDKAEEQLRLVLEYATGNTKAKRDNAVRELRRLLAEEKTNVEST